MTIKEQKGNVLVLVIFVISFALLGLIPLMRFYTSEIVAVGNEKEEIQAEYAAEAVNEYINHVFDIAFTGEGLPASGNDNLALRDLAAETDIIDSVEYVFHNDNSQYHIDWDEEFASDLPEGMRALNDESVGLANYYEEDIDDESIEMEAISYDGSEDWEDALQTITIRTISEIGDLQKVVTSTANFADMDFTLEQPIIADEVRGDSGIDYGDDDNGDDDNGDDDNGGWLPWLFSSQSANAGNGDGGDEITPIENIDNRLVQSFAVDVMREEARDANRYTGWNPLEQFEPEDPDNPGVIGTAVDPEDEGYLYRGIEGSRIVEDDDNNYRLRPYNKDYPMIMLSSRRTDARNQGFNSNPGDGEQNLSDTRDVFQDLGYQYYDPDSEGAYFIDEFNEDGEKLFYDENRDRVTIEDNPTEVQDIPYDDTDVLSINEQNWTEFDTYYYIENRPEDIDQGNPNFDPDDFDPDDLGNPYVENPAIYIMEGSIDFQPEDDLTLTNFYMIADRGVRMHPNFEETYSNGGTGELTWNDVFVFANEGVEFSSHITGDDNNITGQIITGGTVDFNDIEGTFEMGEIAHEAISTAWSSRREKLHWEVETNHLD